MSATVYLVGAGPGDPELLTVKAVRLLARADVVLHDALVSPEILALAPQARLIAVGKRAHRPSTAQRFINRCLVEQAKLIGRQGCVVRLKGGDPAVFGRLEEELAALRAAGIRFEIVPGISAAFGAAASLGVSLTQRGIARAVTLVTPRVAEGLDPHRWDEIVSAQASGSTSVIYMAGRQIETSAQQLLDAGLPRDLPLAVAESVSLPDERTWIGTLAEAAAGAPPIGDGPVVLLIGRALRSADAADFAPAVVEENQARLRAA
jgi:uroporphyrin-III C-methyltransferase